MKIEYFSDTDTLLLEFSTKQIQDSRDLNENTLIEFDEEGKLVSLTIEHAREQADLSEFVFHPGTNHPTQYMVAEDSPEYKTKREEL